MGKRTVIRIKGLSFAKRVQDVNRIYEQHARSGLSNREILRRYIYPLYPISEKTFYNYINASVRTDVCAKQEELSRQQLCLPL